MPFVLPKKPLRECRLALVTTGGVHLPEEARFDIYYPSGDCSYSEIPKTADILTWTHAYHTPDRGGTDLNSVFPLWTLSELEVEGILGELNRRHFSFMGAIHDPAPLRERTAPEVARKLREDLVDAVLLTPS
jgi:D-proline reductase (dithiol) PrdB